MNLGQLWTILGAIVGVGALTVAVSHPQTAQIITATFNGFGSSLHTAMGG